MATISSTGFSYINYTSDGSSLDYEFPFEYIKKANIIVKFDGVVINDYTVTSLNSILFENAPSYGVEISISRLTESMEPLVTFINESSLNKADLNKVNKQVLFALQELADEMNKRLGISDGDYDFFNNIDMHDNRIVNLAEAIDEGDATNLGQVQELIRQVVAGVRVEEEEIVATEGQTIFTLVNFKYTPGYKTISVYVDGIFQSQTDFVETSQTKITFDEAFNGGERVVVRKNDAPSNAIVTKQADYETLGTVIIASNLEALIGTSEVKAITPASLAYVLKRYVNQDASTTQKGIVKLAEVGATGSTVASTPDSTLAQTNTIIGEKIIVTTSTPSDSDGRPDGTIVFQIPLFVNVL